MAQLLPSHEHMDSARQVVSNDTRVQVSLQAPTATSHMQFVLARQASSPRMEAQALMQVLPVQSHNGLASQVTFLSSFEQLDSHVPAYWFHWQLMSAPHVVGLPWWRMLHLVLH